MKVVWLKSAVQDLIRLREFIAKKNPAAAAKVGLKLAAATQQLKQHPETGKPVADLPDYRDFYIPFGTRGYTMRYRVERDTLYIIHIKHYRELEFTF